MQSGLIEYILLIIYILWTEIHPPNQKSLMTIDNHDNHDNVFILPGWGNETLPHVRDEDKDALILSQFGSL